MGQLRDHACLGRGPHPRRPQPRTWGRPTRTPDAPASMPPSGAVNISPTMPPWLVARNRAASCSNASPARRTNSPSVVSCRASYPSRSDRMAASSGSYIAASSLPRSCDTADERASTVLGISFAIGKARLLEPVQDARDGATRQARSAPPVARGSCRARHPGESNAAQVGGIDAQSPPRRLPVDRRPFGEPDEQVIGVQGSG